ncbi:MAG: hypothetical protein AAFP19_08630 [Bacteroidota bacterium]
MNGFEDTLALLAFAIVNDSIADNRFAACHKFIPTLVEALKKPNSFYYPFERLRSISILYPPDSTFRIFTWQLYVDVNEYRYYGAIQMNSPELQLFPLVDRSFDMGMPDYEVLSDKKWYGALYYNLKAFDSPEGKKYLLFGFDGHQFFNKRKLIEVLHFNEEGLPLFGAPVFASANAEESDIRKNRIVLEYTAEAAIRLNYDEQLEMVIFDHLIPMKSLIKEQGNTFVPDGSYEGYQLAEGEWKHVDKVFFEVSPEAPRPAPVLDSRKGKDLFGNR